MAFVVEDGTGLSTATCYASVAYIREYAADRGKSSDLPADDTDVQALGIVATDWADTHALMFQGSKINSTQALQFPRYGVYVDGFYVDSATLPIPLLQCVAQLCLDSNKGAVDIMPNGEGREVVRKRIEGVMDTQYTATGSSTVQPSLSRANAYLKKLYGNNSSQIEVCR